MTLRTLSFVLSDLATGRGLGLGLICPNARYASIAWHGADSFDRRHADPSFWPHLDAALHFGLPVDALPADGPIVRLLLSPERRHEIVVQYVADHELAIDAPGQAAEQLDGELRRITSAS